MKNLFMAQEMRFFGPSASLRAGFLSPQNDSPCFQQSIRASKSHINLEYVKADCREIHLNGTSTHKADSVWFEDGCIGQCRPCKIFGANRYRYHRVKPHTARSDSTTDWPPLT